MLVKNKIQAKILSPLIGDKIPFPSYTTDGSAAIDLRACIEDSLTLKAHSTFLLKTGIAFFIKDPNLAGIILPRSGLGHKHGIILGNSVGLIDSDYQGEIMISLYNRSSDDFLINPGDRIAQFLIIPVLQFDFEIVDEFVKTKRSTGGFGHSGND